MNAVTLASRAVLAQYASKVLRPVEWIAMGVFVLFFIGTVVLATYFSAWWWMLMIVVIAYGLIGSIFWLVLHFTIDRLRPNQTMAQTAIVKSFIGRIEKMADSLHITRFRLLLRIIHDVMARSSSNVLTEFAQASKELKNEFEQVIDTFR